MKTPGPLLFLIVGPFVAATSPKAAPGDLNPSFGSGGKLQVDIGTFETSSGMARRMNGSRFFLAGRDSSNFVVTCHEADGSLRPSFGTGGIATVGFGGTDNTECIALKPPGISIFQPAVLLVGGGTFNGSDYDFAIARLNADDGTLVSSFGSDGLVRSNFGGYEAVKALAFQSDGKIIAGGLIENSSPGSGFDIAIARYTASGVLDATFGSSGKVLDDISGDDSCAALAIQSDDKIVIAGYTTAGGDTILMVSRYYPYGGIDTTFGTLGRLTIPVPEGESFGRSVAIDSIGRIVVGGSYLTATLEFGMVLARVTESGALDSTFGVGGIARSNRIYGASEIWLQRDGKILATGQAPQEPIGNDIGVMRFLPNGAPDRSFGTAGLVQVDHGEINEYPTGILLRSNGSLLVAGSHQASGNFNFTVMCLKLAQADARIGPRATVPRGNDRYNVNGAAQTQSLAVRSRGPSRSVFLGLQNDSANFDKVTARATRGNRHFSVSYFQGRSNATARMVRGVFTTTDLPLGAMTVLRTKVKSKSDRPRLRRRLSLLSASTLDRTGSDVARVNLISR